MRFLYHLARTEDVNADPYAPGSLATEGFIHASYVARVRESARLYFSSADRLVVLRIDPRALLCEVREVATPRGPMPHIHGAVPRVAIRARLPIEEFDDERELSLEARATESRHDASSRTTAPSTSTPATSLAMATYLELLEVEAKRSLAIEWDMIAGGCASYGGPGSHVNRGVGMGISEPLTEDDASAITRFYALRQEDAHASLASFADARSLASLAAHGFVLDDVHHVLVCPLRSDSGPAAATALDCQLPRGESVVIERLDASDESQVRDYVRVASSGFLPEGAEVPETIYTAGVAAARWDGASSFTARVSGRVVAAAGSATKGGITSLFGTSVLPEYRRHGIHRALMAARLEDGRIQGASWATVTSIPGGPTERNAIRAGFTLAYARNILVKPYRGAP